MSAAAFAVWFRSDRRLHDNPNLHAACQAATANGVPLLPVVVHDPANTTTATPWGFARRGPQRSAWEAEAEQGLARGLASLGADLTRLHGPTAVALADWCRSHGVTRLWCEDIPCPEEQAQVAALRRTGLTVHTVWGSTLVAPGDLPWEPARVPDVFTTFRQKLEAADVCEAPPLAAPTMWPLGETPAATSTPTPPPAASPPAANAPPGSEAAGLAHLANWCAGGHPHHYKATRNAADTRLGTQASSRWSPWLATGALSARQAMAAIRHFEAERGANDGTYWLWFELLWRDHFRWLHAKHGLALYRARGLGQLPAPTHNPKGFERWCQGRTGQPLVDAGMRELAATGWLSNRLRQIVASYLIHDLGADWRAGAAWFEHALIDYDPCSNQGNWLYISGRGTDPRGGRRFNPEKQTADHDAHGHYRRLWGTAV